jgi:hypothetical protein
LLFSSRHNACLEAVEDAITVLGKLSRRDSTEGLAAVHLAWAGTDADITDTGIHCINI